MSLHYATIYNMTCFLLISAHNRFVMIDLQYIIKFQNDTNDVNQDEMGYLFTINLYLLSSKRTYFFKLIHLRCHFIYDN